MIILSPVLTACTLYNKVVKCAEAHLVLATKARSYLKAQVKSAKDSIKAHYIDKGLAMPSIGACLTPASNNVTMHFSFDRFEDDQYYYHTKSCLLNLHIRCTIHVILNSPAQCTF